MNRPLVFAAGLALGLFPAASSAGNPAPPDLGIQTPLNRYQPRFTGLYRQDFENGLEGVSLVGAGATRVSRPTWVLDGRYSLRLKGTGAQAIIKPSALALKPYGTYVLEFDYRIKTANPGKPTLVALAQWTGLPTNEEGFLGGLLDGLHPARGSLRLALRVPDVPDAHFSLLTYDSEVLLDNIKVSRLDRDLLPARPPLIKAGFPRLGNYSLLTPAGAAFFSGQSIREVEAVLGLFDLINGLQTDYTLEDIGWIDHLKAINPDILLLPYFESYVAQNPGQLPRWGAAGLVQLYNRSLAEAWFMHGPDGARLNEPLYPGNYQLNHTRLAPAAEGGRLKDHAARFLARSVLPTGFWQGVHFDEAGWEPNSLLAEGDPFLGTAGALPPIDLDGDGLRESTETLHTAWRQGFDDYFAAMYARFGHTQLIFGNAGHIPNNPAVLSRLNGWQREFAMPFALDGSGNWDTRATTGWYTLLSDYQAACRYARAPQVISLEFSGYGLGEPTGTKTANGLADRKPVLENRDFRRMRLGLGTALLGCGFYEYDFVDNTTAPVWFDEYAVDKAGMPVRSLRGKGWLGQPLGEAVELPYPHRELLRVDAELPPPGDVRFHGAFRITHAPGEVIDGGQSLVFDSVGDPGNTWEMISTEPADYPLQVGKTYQMSVDFKLLDYRPAYYLGAFYAALDTGSESGNSGAVTMLPNTDIGGLGQSGRLRIGIKLDKPDARLRLGFLDSATVAIDNLSLIEGGGGVWRRDFENGVVLVNPTPDPIEVDPAQIAGPLRRTGIRRIRGTQDPLWNNGLAVAATLVIPSGDAILLLADRIAAPALVAPADLTAGPPIPGRVGLGWKPVRGAAGYLIEYGQDGGALGRFALAGAGDAPGLNIAPLTRGTGYRFRVAAFDWRGRTGPFGPVLAAKSGGHAKGPVPTLATVSALAPGLPARLTGTDLGPTPAVNIDQAPWPTAIAGTRVLVDGVPARLSAVGPDHAEFFAPPELAGEYAWVAVERNGVAGPETQVQVTPAPP